MRLSRRRRLKKSCNIADPDLGVLGTMTMFLAKSFPSFHFEGDDLVALNVVDDLGFDNSLYIFTDCQGISVREEDLTEFYLVAGVAREAGNVQSLIFLDLELLTGYFHDC